MLKSFRAGAVLGLGLLTLTALAGPALAFGALALSDDGASGWSHNYPSKGRAREEALQQCGPGCRVVLDYWNGCGAYAADSASSSSANGWGTGKSRNAAQNLAVSECEDHGGDTCTIQVWACE
jgi:hypothetical protein